MLPKNVLWAILYNFICVDGKPKTVAKIEHSLTTYPVGK